MMRILAAPDSYKESLRAADLARHIADGVKRIIPDAEVLQMPLSDGGDGLTEALCSALEGKILQRDVTGPMGYKVTASFGLLKNNTAVIEMAEASGLALVKRESRNPMHATTYGTGELIRAALDLGCRKMIIGIGGSATNDGGAGMAQALGVRMLNEQGKDIPYGAYGLLELDAIDMSAVDPRLASTEILVACDVSNPLCGPQGAAMVYALQKGAAKDSLSQLDQALLKMALIVKRELGYDVLELPGAGAAGGLGAGLVAFAGGKLKPGVDLLMDTLEIDKVFASGLDLVITGEGAINEQSLYGKVPVGVARRAKKYGVPVLALVGSIGPGAEKLYAEGIDVIMSIAPGPISLEEAMARTGELVEEASSQAMRLILMGRNAGKQYIT